MTAATPSSKSFSQFIEGLQFPGMFSAETVRSAIHYKARTDDLFIVTYPKCGTTWTQHILLLILRHGQPLENRSQFFTAAPFLEMAGAEAVESMPRPVPIKVHLPFHLTPWNEHAKYIYVTRNPRDCCVSYFHHMRNIPGHEFNGTFDDFFEMFLSGEVDYGDYFDHLHGWYEHRNDPNVLFITYEQLKERPEETILKMASFVDDKLYAEPLRNDPEKLNNVIKYSSFNYMKENVNKAFEDMMSMSKEDLQSSSLPDRLKALFGQENLKPPTGDFVRKGIIGDWRNYFSEEQKQRLDEKFLLKTKGTDIPALFQKYMQN